MSLTVGTGPFSRRPSGQLSFRRDDPGSVLYWERCRRLLQPSASTSSCPYKGDAAYWSLRVGDRVIEDAVWGCDAPLPTAPPLAGYRALHWDRVDAWCEKDEMVVVHPRDPYHRADALASSRHVFRGARRPGPRRVHPADRAVRDGAADALHRPDPAIAVLRDRIAFLHEKLEVTVDGELLAPSLR